MSMNGFSFEFSIETVMSPKQFLILGIGISIICLIIVVSMWKLFTKANKAGWKALIPFYNIYILIEIVSLPGSYLLLSLIPIVNIYAIFKILIGLAHKFGHSTGYGIAMVFLSPILLPMLAFGSSIYELDVSQAPTMGYSYPTNGVSDQKENTQQMENSAMMSQLLRSPSQGKNDTKSSAQENGTINMGMSQMSNTGMMGGQLNMMPQQNMDMNGMQNMGMMGQPMMPQQGMMGQPVVEPQGVPQGMPQQTMDMNGMQNMGMMGQPMMNQPMMQQPIVEPQGIPQGMPQQTMDMNGMQNMGMMGQPMMNQPMMDPTGMPQQPMDMSGMQNMGMMGQPMMNQPMMDPTGMPQQPMDMNGMQNMGMMGQPMANQPMMGQPMMGQMMAGKKVCPACGNQIDLNAPTCFLCGYKF